MSARFLTRWGPLWATLSVAISYFAGGWRGAAGMSLGIFASAFGLIVWWLVIQLVANAAKSADTRPSAGSFLVILAFLLKLPLFFAAAFLTVKIGGISRTCFLIGLGQVYLALVGRSLSQDADQPT